MENDPIVQIMLNQQSQIATDVSALRADTSKAITHLEIIDTRNKYADEFHRDVEARIRLLERFRYTLLGISLVMGFLSGFLGYYIGHLAK
jgi:hypothetical protein